MADRTRSGTSDAGSTRPGVAVSPAVAAVLLAAAGAALRLWQYLANSSLWIDEAALARNIIDRAPTSLLQPLDYAQVAPPAFLLTEKAITTLLGGSEWALRLFPLVCGLFAIWLFWRLAGMTLTGWAVPYAVGLFSLGTPLVYFSSQVKQYSTDVAAMVVVLWAVLRLRHQPSGAGGTLVAAIAGAAAAWFSHAAIFGLAGIGAALAVSAVIGRRWTDHRSALVIGATWALGAGLAAALALRNVQPADRAYLEWYWSGGLMPFPPATFDDALWLWRRLTWLFGTFATELRRSNGGLGYPWSSLFVLLAIAGIAALWRRERETALILLGPVLATATGAALHVYPFTGRAISFLLPVFLLATAAGADHVLTNWPGRLQFASPALLALALGSPVYAALLALPPERTEELRPVLEAVAARRQAGDAMYGFYGAGQAFMYYAPRLGLAGADVVLGRCSFTDMRVYLRDVDQFRGRSRVWVVATHARMEAAELKTITGYLDTIGRRLDSIEVRSTSSLASTSAYAFLYDLGDRDRLRASSSDSYPVPASAADEGFARWGCYGTQSALRRSGRL
jgi:hypothetical protein